MTKKKGFLAGTHTSIAGGIACAAELARRTGCDCFQVFSRNPRGWASAPLSENEVADFIKVRERAELSPFVIHSVYLINLAAQDQAVLDKSREGFREELVRALRLGADYLVVHPGSARGVPVSAGIRTAVESIQSAARGLKLLDGRGSGLRILIENTAGQGASIGCSFEQIAEIVYALEDLGAGVCLDTAHTFESGYDIASATGLRQTVRSIEATFGIERIGIIHCNDSKTPLGSRVDRHEHIGLGHIGEEGFRLLTHNLKFRRIPFILETPVDSERSDEWNLERLRSLAGD